jgi:hypothetical protein
VILELIAFAMLGTVLALKYGAVIRIVRLKQRLREAEGRCRKQKDYFRTCEAERMGAQRDQSNVVRQRRILQDEVTRITVELEKLKMEKRTIMEELIRRNARIDSDLMTNGAVASDKFEN